MPTERVRLPGGRDVRASLDSAEPRSAGNRTQSDDSERLRPSNGRPQSEARAVVVACPPHPQHGGDRHDGRLRAVSEALPARIDCLRIDYGPWDEGRGERADARTACEWAADRYDRVGLFGYSFGGGVALLTAADVAGPVAALSPVARLDDGSDVAAAVDRIDEPLWVGYGTRDGTVDAERVAEAAREHGGAVERFEADHFFVGQEATVGRAAASFLADAV